jgi:hypothetical protein
MESCVVKSSKKVPWKHRFDKPHGSTSRTLSETHTRTEGLHLGVLAQTSRRKMFPLDLGPEAKPPVERALVRYFRGSQKHGEDVPYSCSVHATALGRDLAVPIQINKTLFVQHP